MNQKQDKYTMDPLQLNVSQQFCQSISAPRAKKCWVEVFGQEIFVQKNFVKKKLNEVFDKKIFGQKLIYVRNDLLTKIKKPGNIMHD